MLVDSDVCMDYLNRIESPWTARVAEIVRGDIPGWCSVVTVAEVLEGCRNAAEHREAAALFATLTDLPVRWAEAETAAALRRRWRSSNGIGMPDALIGATAIVADLPLLTRSVGHFQGIPGLVLVEA
jgi:predicted nucleic acid-binding protein